MAKPTIISSRRVLAENSEGDPQEFVVTLRGLKRDKPITARPTIDAEIPPTGNAET